LKPRRTFRALTKGEIFSRAQNVDVGDALFDSRRRAGQPGTPGAMPRGFSRQVLYRDGNFDMVGQTPISSFAIR